MQWIETYVPPPLLPTTFYLSKWTLVILFATPVEILWFLRLNSFYFLTDFNSNCIFKKDFSDHILLCKRPVSVHQRNPPRRVPRWKKFEFSTSALRITLFSSLRWKWWITDIYRWFCKVNPNEFWYYHYGITQTVLGVCQGLIGITTIRGDLSTEISG